MNKLESVCIEDIGTIRCGDIDDKCWFVAEDVLKILDEDYDEILNISSDCIMHEYVEYSGSLADFDDDLEHGYEVTLINERALFWVMLNALPTNAVEIYNDNDGVTVDFGSMPQKVRKVRELKVWLFTDIFRWVGKEEQKQICNGVDKRLNCHFDEIDEFDEFDEFKKLRYV